MRLGKINGMQGSSKGWFKTELCGSGACLEVREMIQIANSNHDLSTRETIEVSVADWKEFTQVILDNPKSLQIDIGLLSMTKGVQGSVILSRGTTSIEYSNLEWKNFVDGLKKSNLMVT